MFYFPAPDTPPRPRRQRISSRVHFPEDVHDPEIHVSRERDGGVDVNLGFLQVNHRYKCQFTVINSVSGPVHAPEVKPGMIRGVTAYVNQDGKSHLINTFRSKVTAGCHFGSKVRGQRILWG